jgi:hypothetical protein
MAKAEREKSRSAFYRSTRKHTKFCRFFEKRKEPA